MTDIEIIKKFQKGDRDAFETIIQKYHLFIFKTAYKILKSIEDAEDITQEVFIKLYNNLNQFEFKSDIKTYIYKITVNCSFDLLRKTHTKELLIEKGKEKIFDNTTSIDDELIEEEIINDLFESIRKLPEKYREIIYLKDFESKTYSEISQKLNITENAAKLRHRYALKKLRERFFKER